MYLPCFRLTGHILVICARVQIFPINFRLPGLAIVFEESLNAKDNTFQRICLTMLCHVTDSSSFISKFAKPSSMVGFGTFVFSLIFTSSLIVSFIVFF